MITQKVMNASTAIGIAVDRAMDIAGITFIAL